jgi:hypothetical protein
VEGVLKQNMGESDGTKETVKEDCGAKSENGSKRERDHVFRMRREYKKGIVIVRAMMGAEIPVRQQVTNVPIPCVNK